MSAILVRRASANPILTPDGAISWKSKAVFNPGVIEDAGKIRLLYRAVGDDFVSRFGYAESTDGITLSNMLNQPIFAPDPNNEFETAGCEDPRITKIDDTFYITYCGASLETSQGSKLTASPFAGQTVDGEQVPWRTRVSLASTKDFHNFNRFGVILPDVNSKDAVLFPEKINGRYTLLHRIWPDIYLASSADLKNWQQHGPIMSPRENSWDCRNIGAGAVPVKTSLGWMLIYHGVDLNLVYRLGVAVLDLNTPAKVLYQSDEPIFWPANDYEKNGNIKNVVFTCGMIERAEQLYLYYGAADTSIGLAVINKAELIERVRSEIMAKQRVLAT